MKKILWYIFVSILVITAIAGDIYMAKTSNINHQINNEMYK